MSRASVRLVKCLRGNAMVTGSSDGSLAGMSEGVRVLYSTSALPEDHESEKMVSEGGGSTASFHEKKAEISTKGKGEGGGSAASFHEKKAEISTKGKGEAPAGTSEFQQTKEAAQDTWQSAADKAKGTWQQGKESAPEAERRASDTWQEGKENGGSVVDSIKGRVKKEVDTATDMLPRDIPKKVSDAGRDLKEVGQEAAQAVKRDASRVAEKVGLKNPSSSSHRSDDDR